MQKRLTYFAARGTCDAIRLLLAETGIPYEEEIITGRQFSLRRNEGKLVFGVVPIWEDGNLKISHASAILRHLARLYGSNEHERAMCDMWEVQIDKIQNELWKADFVQKDDISDFKINEMKIKFFNEVLVQELTFMAEMMSLNESPFVVGNQLTFIDIKLFSFLEALDKEFKLALPSFPIFNAFREFIGKRPKINSLTKLGKRY